MPTSRDLAQQFLIHFNARDQDALLSLLHADVRYNGRHGEGEGIHLLQEWVKRATTTMTPRRWFGRESLAVVEVDVQWRSAATAEITDQAIWAIAVAAEGDRIVSIARYADVGEAVTKMGLQPDDVLPEAASTQ